MNKKILIVIVLVLIESCSLYLLYKSSNDHPPVTLDDVVVDEKQNDIIFNYYLEQTYNMKDYVLNNDENWNKDEYTINMAKSTCFDGEGEAISKALVLDKENNYLIVDSILAKNCSLYYDKKIIEEVSQ